MSHDGGPPARILLLGATGRVGTLLRRCRDAGADLIPVARRSTPGCVVWAPGQDCSSLPPRVDAIAALWGVTPGGGRDVSENVALAREAQALGDALGARVVLHASSVAVYAPSAVALTEDAPREPANAYGAAKAQMEDVVGTYTGAGPRAVSLRIGSVAGAESLFAALAGDGPVTLDRFADGQGPERSYIAPSDLARVIVLLSLADPERLPAALNIAAPRPSAMADIARAAGREVLWRDAPPGARQSVTLDTSRLQELCRLPDAASDPAHLVADWRNAAGEPA